MPLPIYVARALEKKRSARRRHHLAKTANFTVQRIQTGATFTNLGASATITFTLGAMGDEGKGVNYTFFVAAAQKIRVTPTSGAFYFDAAKQTDAKYLELSNIGSWLYVEGDGNNDWITHWAGTIQIQA